MLSIIGGTIFYLAALLIVLRPKTLEDFESLATEFASWANEFMRASTHVALHRYADREYREEVWRRITANGSIATA